jgi:hypothetical protein
MPSRRAVLAGAGSVTLVVVGGAASYLESCSGSVPGLDPVQKGDEVTVGGEVRTVASDGTSIRIVGGTTAIVEFPPPEWDDAKALSTGSCVTGINGTVRGIDHTEGIIFIENGEI